MSPVTSLNLRSVPESENIPSERRNGRNRGNALQRTVENAGVFLTPLDATWDLDRFVAEVGHIPHDDGLEPWVKGLSEAEATQLFITLLDRNPRRSSACDVTQVLQARGLLGSVIKKSDVQEIAAHPDTALRQLRLWIERHGFEGLPEIEGTYVKHVGAIRAMERRLVKKNVQEVVRRAFRNHSVPRSDRTFVDIGCWDGDVLQDLKEFCGRAIGIEPSAKNYDQLLANAPWVEPINADIQTVMADPLMYGNVRGDCFIMSHVLYFLRRDEQDFETLLWVTQKLNNGGIGIVILNDTELIPFSRAHLRRTIAGGEKNPDPLSYQTFLERRGMRTTMFKPALSCTAETPEGRIALRDVLTFLLPGQARHDHRAIDAYLQCIEKNGGTFKHRLAVLVFAKGWEGALRAADAPPQPLETTVEFRSQWREITEGSREDRRHLSPLPPLHEGELATLPRIKGSADALPAQEKLDLLRRIAELTDGGINERRLTVVLDHLKCFRSTYHRWLEGSGKLRAQAERNGRPEVQRPRPSEIIAHVVSDSRAAPLNPPRTSQETECLRRFGRFEEIRGELRAHIVAVLVRQINDPRVQEVLKSLRDILAHADGSIPELSQRAGIALPPEISQEESDETIIRLGLHLSTRMKALRTTATESKERERSGAAMTLLRIGTIADGTFLSCAKQIANPAMLDLLVSKERFLELEERLKRTPDAPAAQEPEDSDATMEVSEEDAPETGDDGSEEPTNDDLTWCEQVLIETVEKAPTAEPMERSVGVKDSFELYLEQACSKPPLTRKEELELTAALEAARRAWRQEILGSPRVQQSVLEIYEEMLAETRSSGDRHIRLRRGEKGEEVLSRLRELFPRMQRAAQSGGGEQLTLLIEQIPLQEHWLRHFEKLLTEELAALSASDGNGQDCSTHLGESAELFRERAANISTNSKEWNRLRHALAERNTRLVITVAKHYRGLRGVPFADLVMDGNAGLMRAIDKYDPERRFKFSTYATWWVRQAIGRSLSDNSRTIRLPVHIVKNIGEIFRKAVPRIAELGEMPTIAELAEATGLSAEQIVRALAMSDLRVASLDTPVLREEKKHLGDLLADRSTPDPSGEADILLRRDALIQMLRSLPPRERDVILQRFGLELEEVIGPGGRVEFRSNAHLRQKTLKETTPRKSTEYGSKEQVTRERVRQLQNKAYDRMHNWHHPLRYPLARLAGIVHSPPQRMLPSDPKLALAVAELPVSPRVMEAFERNGIYLVADLLENTQRELLELQSYSDGLHQQVCKALKRAGITATHYNHLPFFSGKAL